MNKKAITSAAALLVLIPAFAVLNEKNLSQTLSVLRYELRSSYMESEARSARMKGSGERQHARLVGMMQQSNELSLMLYSQKQDYTFDMTYALNEVSRQYDEFSSRKLPFDDIINRLDIDIDRYDRLIHTLRSIPPSSGMEYVDSLGNVVVLGPGPRGPRPGFAGPPPSASADAPGAKPFHLDSLGCVDRDSCIFYANCLMEKSMRQKERLVRDSTHYRVTSEMLRSAYDYAQQRYRTVQNRIFIEGQTPYFKLLKSFKRYWNQAKTDSSDKYSRKAMGGVHSQWRGPMVVGFSIFVLFWLIVSVLLSVTLTSVFSRKIKSFNFFGLECTRSAMAMLLSVVIFAVSIMVASAISDHNFFRMAAKILVEFAWMMAAILLSLVIRLDEKSERKGIAMYLPILLMCFIIIGFRIAFIPNSLINIVFPPVLLLFTVFQALTLGRYRKALPQGDIVFGWVSLFAMVVTTVIAFSGYVLMGVQLLIWWFFQLTLLQTVSAVYDILDIYYNKHIREVKKRYIEEHREMPHKTDEDMIAVTWPHALVKKALLPMAIVLSIPFSFYMASGVFDLTGIFREWARYPFLNFEGYISLSFSKIVLVVTLFFAFSFINYAAKACYRIFKIRSILRRSSVKVMNENQVNFTLAENIIAISLWGIYVIALFALLRIPTAAIKVVGAGLATGLGFAMKDILNNFFYGVQLMSGRLRVGDFVECDGVRGKVDSITYQSTQIVAADGSVMAFPNSTLFNKNFKNLTRNHSYELLSFEVGVKYGVDVEEVRGIIISALEPLRTQDRFGRDVVDPAFGVQVRFASFGDSSVNLQVVQFTTVEEHFTYAAKAKELIYNALNEHGIEIPFPQRDLYVKSLPGKEN